MERERGTLRKTLTRKPEMIFALVNLVATGAAVFCCRSQVSSREGWPAVIVGSALSSLATLGGIVYADSAIHSFFLGLAVSVAAVTSACSSVSLSSILALPSYYRFSLHILSMVLLLETIERRQ